MWFKFVSKQLWGIFKIQQPMVIQGILQWASLPNLEFASQISRVGKFSGEEVSFFLNVTHDADSP